MAVIRRLEELEKQSKGTKHGNLNFGALQEIHHTSSGVTYVQSRGIIDPQPMSKPLSFSIYSDNQSQNQEKPVDEVPWKRFETAADQSKENQRSCSENGLIGCRVYFQME